MIAAGDAEAIERATLAVLPPRVLVVDDGWLLGANDGVISRANSVVPLEDGEHSLDEKIDRAIAFYERQGLGAAFRVSPYSRPVGMAQALASRGFEPGMTTLVMTRPIEHSDSADEAVRLDDAADASWRSLFIAPGVAAEDADIRVKTLSRGRGTRFASLEAGGEFVAIGAASVSGDWAGLHGMRTLDRHRGRGFGAKVLSRLLHDARKRGANSAFLQVEEVNRDAIRLYERLGFRTAYAYDYWRAPR